MADDHTTSPPKCHHLMHLPSGKCIGCGEQHQPLADYQPGDDEAFMREHLAKDRQPQSPSTGEDAAQLIANSAFEAMKAKEEASDQAQPLISDDGAGVIKGSGPSPADEIKRQRRMSLLDARKSLITGDDGYVVFWPTSNVGAYTSYDLREIADELDKRNAPWDAIIQSDPRISGAAIRNTPQAIEATPRSDGESEK